MNKVNWIFQKDLILRSTTTISELMDICENLNVNYWILDNSFNIEDYKLISEITDGQLGDKHCVVIYGSYEFTKKISNYISSYTFTNPLCYCNIAPLSYSFYSKYFNEELFNQDYVNISFGEFRKNPYRFYDLYNTTDIFIRPNKVTKSFSGFTLEIDEIEKELFNLKNSLYVDDEEMIVVSPSKKCGKEYRFTVVNKEIVSYSHYDHYGNISRNDVPIQCIDFMETLIKKFNPDLVYTCDIIESLGAYYLLEYNSFSCSGWYDMDANKIIEKVSKMALMEFEGKITMGEDIDSYSI